MTCEHAWTTRVVRRALVPAVAAIAFAAQGAFAQGVDFSGQQIEVYAPGEAGGGNDIYARTMAPFFEQYLPGNPRLLVVNLPGAGTIAGSNHFQAHAEPDGLHMTSVSASTPINYAFRDGRVRYELETWEPILLSPLGSIVYASPRLGIEGPEDLPALRDELLIYGGNGPTSADLGIILSFHLLDLPVRTVWGMSRGPARLAYERGETNINFDSTPGYLRSRENLEEAGGAVPLFTFGLQDEDGNFVRDPNFPDVPSFVELYEMVHGVPPSGVEFDAWVNVFQMTTMTNKYFALPAGTPPEIIETYREAAAAMIADPAVMEAASAVLEGYPQFVGEHAREVVLTAITVRPEVWDWLNGWLAENYDVRLGN